MTPDVMRAITTDPWSLVATSGMLGYLATSMLFRTDTVERDAWPPKSPVVEMEKHTDFLGSVSRYRVHRVGREWIGIGRDAPASFCVAVEHDGARMFGVRVRF